MVRLDTVYLSQRKARAKPWWFFTLLFMVAFLCVSCQADSQQSLSSQKKIAQLPHHTEARRLPLTNSVPLQMETIPTVLPSSTQRTPIIPTPISTPPSPPTTSYEAESAQNTLTGGATVIVCGRRVCSGRNRVGYLGPNADKVGTLQFNNLYKSSGDQYTLTIYYILAGSDTPTLYISVNGGSAVIVKVPATPNGDTVGTTSITINLNAGNNRIAFFNPLAFAPDIDRIAV